MLKTPEQKEQARLEMLARKEQKRASARRASARRASLKRHFKSKEVRRVTAWRKRKKAEKKAARHLEIVAEKAARALSRAVREEKKACDMRKHATAQAGFVAGWSAVVPQTDQELKALSWSRRYREAYAHGAAEKRRSQELMAAQQREPLCN
jgi:hypothetical protein